ncbi:translation initiation factor eIF4e [Sodiomyces alkalinus F11]|uniref:Translation initiation factor eIF4e n=1 Tax=Sodiomyces alkalinus (strain CBS 110278 / VKM F-3762 / F11) TaxID=1314773 RepID=A0A3N2PY16_SODAK|nr:translation initiation factor eIF4e [Sodiomyces alkalinus F11]ROT39306.1 translation initiation factor eIF4e [Sodiomyces alkalinus F11]
MYFPPQLSSSPQLTQPKNLDHRLHPSRPHLTLCQPPPVSLSRPASNHSSCSPGLLQHSRKDPRQFTRFSLLLLPLLAQEPPFEPEKEPSSQFGKSIVDPVSRTVPMENNLWTRRTKTLNAKPFPDSSGKLSLSTSGHGTTAPAAGDSTRNGSFSKRFGGDSSSHGKSNPFNTVTTPGGSGVASPTASASNAFGLGSGAFASFGSGKTPKSTGNPFEATLGKNQSSSAKAGSSDKAPGDSSLAKAPSMASIAEIASGTGTGSKTNSGSQTSSVRGSSEVARPPHTGPRTHPLKYEWVTWCRPCQPKGQPFEEYAKSLTPLVHCSTLEDFVRGFRHLKHPSELPVGWEYHFFKKGIRPVWEDEVNRNGGKWVLRLKKGIADRYWEDTRFALLGDAFQDVGEEICGGVVSIRNGEDVISIWTRSTGGRVLRIRETWKNYLQCPPSTVFEFKSHDESIQHRAAIEESRREKQQDKRKQVASDDQKLPPA